MFSLFKRSTTPTRAQGGSKGAYSSPVVRVDPPVNPNLVVSSATSAALQELLGAIAQRDLKSVKEIMGRMSILPGCVDSAGRLPLHYAVESVSGEDGPLDIVQALLDKERDHSKVLKGPTPLNPSLEHADKAGNTPIALAVRK